MLSAVEEVIFALRTQGMSQKGIAARVGCSQSTVSRILKKDFPAPVNNGGRPKKTLLKTTAPLKENYPLQSLQIDHQHHSLVERDNDITCFKVNNLPATAVPWFFQAGYPALSLSYPANTRKNVYSLHRSIPNGRWRTGSKSSSLMNRNSSWVMATRDLVFGGKSMKGTRRLV